MKILFAGTPRFAVPSLQGVALGFNICGVLTAPNKPVGRGRKTCLSPVKQEALKLGLKIFQPKKLNKEFIDELKSLSPDLLVVAAYGKIFKQDFLDLFPQGGINVHPSLLPQFRGPSPITAAILAGVDKTGVTIQKLALKMDSGDILSQKEYPLNGSETTGALEPVLAGIGARLLVEALKKMQKGNITGMVQDHTQATYCKLITKEQGCIDWKQSASAISRKIRAFDPWPRAYTFFGRQKLFLHKGGVYKIEVNTAQLANGQVFGVDKEVGILIKTGKGILCVQELQLECKKLLNWADFLNGNKNIINSVLGGE